MATRTVTSRDWIKPAMGNIRLFPTQLPEGATQSFKIGAPLTYSAVSTFEDNVIQFVEDNTSGIVGVAAQAASGTQGTPTSAWIADTDAEFEGVVVDGVALAATMLTGGPYSLHYDSSNTIWRVDTSDTGHDVVIITALVDPIGTVNGRVRFMFIPAARLPYQG